MNEDFNIDSIPNPQTVADDIESTFVLWHKLDDIFADYANIINKSVGELTEIEKQIAILNYVLEGKHLDPA